MDINKRTTKISIIVAFVAVIAVIIALSCGIILSTPTVSIDKRAGNYGGNFMNGADVLADDGFVFYVNPNDKGLYRADSDNAKTKSVKIADNCGGYLQVSNNMYYFLQGNNLVCCDYKGESLKTVLENVKAPQVVGGSVYYIAQNGSLSKYVVRYKESTDMGVKPKDNFLVYNNRIYYNTDKGICSVSTTGGNEKTFLNEKADKFVFDEKYLFYKKDGAAYSAVNSDGEMKSTKITDADSFFVIIGKSPRIVYSTENGIYYADMNKVGDDGYKPKELCKKPGKVFGDQNYFYWYNEKGALCRVEANGKNAVEFN